MVTNDEYRAEQAERRQHGLKARHEQRLENATYTAAEVKVLTETATKLGYELGRKEVLAERCRCFAGAEHTIEDHLNWTSGDAVAVNNWHVRGIAKGDPA